MREKIKKIQIMLFVDIMFVVMMILDVEKTGVLNAERNYVKTG
jgi:biopolymer transport protein ExbD